MNDKNIIVNKPEPKPGILERSDLFAIAVGMVIGSGMVTLIGPAMAYTGYSVWLAYLTAIVMGFFMVFPYIILGGTMRVAGGPYSIVTNLSGVSTGGLVAYTKLVTPILNSSFALALGLYLNNLLPGITVKALAIAGVVILFVLNLLGMDIFAKVSKILSTVLLITMVLYVVFGLTQIRQPIFNFSGDKMFTGGFKGFMLRHFFLSIPQMVTTMFCGMVKTRKEQRKMFRLRQCPACHVCFLFMWALRWLQVGCFLTMRLQVWKQSFRQHRRSFLVLCINFL